MKKVVIETGHIDSNNDKIDLDGMTIPQKRMVLLKDFDHYSPIGVCHVIKEDGVLKAEIEATENFAGYMAIGINILDFHANEQGGKDITKCQLVSVSICKNRNTDLSIKKIAI